MVNVGSVGQPRDGDNRACYVILEDGLGDEGSNGDGRSRPGTAPPAFARKSPIAGCLTILRKPSRRSTPFPSSSRSWAIGSGKDGSRVPSTRRVRRRARLRAAQLQRRAFRTSFFVLGVP